MKIEWLRRTFAAALRNGSGLPTSDTIRAESIALFGTSFGTNILTKVRKEFTAKNKTPSTVATTSPAPTKAKVAPTKAKPVSKPVAEAKPARWTPTSESLQEAHVLAHKALNGLGVEGQKDLSTFLLAFDADRHMQCPAPLRKFLAGFRGQPRVFLLVLIEALEDTPVLMATFLRLHKLTTGRLLESTLVNHVAQVTPYTFRDRNTLPFIKLMKPKAPLVEGSPAMPIETPIAIIKEPEVTTPASATDKPNTDKPTTPISVVGPRDLMFIAAEAFIERGLRVGLEKLNGEFALTVEGSTIRFGR